MNSLWSKLSVRERRLAVGALAVVTFALMAALANRAVARVRSLDDLIAQLEQNLVNYAELEARGKSVDKAYVEVAAQHSSAWTEAEIHNRLRQEIYRLAQENPEAPSGSKTLVEIPVLRQGKLRDTGQGYREYLLDIRITPTDIYSVMMFLMRLQASPQSLRIDGLELARAPDSQLVQATINVTRTVVAGAPPEGAEAVPKGPATLVTWDGSTPDPWQAQGGELAVATAVGEQKPDGGSCAKLTPTEAHAAAYIANELEAGRSYEFSVDVAAAGDGAVLGVLKEGEAAPYAGAEPLPPAGAPYRYTVMFTVPGTPGERVKVWAPYVAASGGNGAVYLDNVQLKELAE